MLFIFDWDGTLSDSTDKIINCMQHAARVCALPVRSREQVKNIIGLGLDQAIRALYPDHDDSALGSMKQAYADHFVHGDTTPTHFFPGVIDVLGKLRSHGHILTIATGKSRKGLDRVLTQWGLRDLFHDSRCADETSSKPDPHMLHELLDQFCVVADEAVMVGDTEYDMAMAQQIAMPRIAVSYGAHHIDRLKAYNPVLCVDHFSQIYDWYTTNLSAKT